MRSPMKKRNTILNMIAVAEASFHARVAVALVIGKRVLTCRLALVSYVGVSCVPDIPGLVG